MFDFHGKRVFVAGGSSGIGLATAKLLGDYGASVIISGRDTAKLAAAEQQCGPNVSSVACDAADPEQRAKALAYIGKFDHLVIALSGGKGVGPFASVSQADVRSGFEAKFWIHFALAQEAIAHLHESGSITFVSANSVRSANPGTAGLAAINAAIEGLVKPLAIELRPCRVNAVAPGVIDTPWWNRFPEAQKLAAFKNFADATPVGRIGKPEDVASAIVFLIGNSFMTGCIIECDGGLRLAGQKL